MLFTRAPDLKGVSTKNYNKLLYHLKIGAVGICFCLELYFGNVMVSKNSDIINVRLIDSQVLSNPEINISQ